MARRFAKVSEEEIEKAFFYPSDLITLRVSVYIHHYSPPLRGIVVFKADRLQMIVVAKKYICVGTVHQ